MAGSLFSFYTPSKREVVAGQDEVEEAIDNSYANRTFSSAGEVGVAQREVQEIDVAEELKVEVEAGDVEVKFEGTALKYEEAVDGDGAGNAGEDESHSGRSIHTAKASNCKKNDSSDAQEEGDRMHEDADAQKDNSTRASKEGADSDSKVSKKIERMMVERVSALDTVRALLKRELKQDCALLSEFTDEVARLEQIVTANGDEIAERNSRLRDLTARAKQLNNKNDEDAREIQRLSHTIDELKESNRTVLERMVELDKKVAAYKEEIEEMHEAMAEKQCMLDQNIEDNTELVRHLEQFKEQNEELQSTVLKLESQNTDHVEELELLTSSLEELLDQIAEHETKTGQLSQANNKLGEEILVVQQKNAELLYTVEDLEETIEHGKAREAKLTAEKARVEATLDQAKAKNETAHATIDQLQAEYVAASKKEQEDNAAVVAHLNATIEDMRCQASKLKKDHEATLADVAADHETAINALGKTLETEMEANAMLAAEAERLAETLTSAESAVLGLEAALGKTTEKYEEEIAAVTTMVEEHAERQRLCRLQVNAEHEAIVAKLEAAATSSAEENKSIMSKMVEGHNTKISELKENYEATLSDTKASLTSSTAVLTSAEEKHKARMLKMTEEHKSNVLKMKARHTTSMSDMKATMMLSAKMHKVTESDMKAALAFSRDEHKTAVKKHEAEMSKHSKTVVELQGRARDAGIVKAEKDELQDSDISLVISADQNLKETAHLGDEKAKLTEDNQRLRNQLKDSQMSLVVVADQNEKLTEQNEELANQKAALEKEMAKEQSQMTDQQRHMELLLGRALAGKAQEDKENTEERSSKKIFKGTVFGGVPSTRPPPSPRVPLSPKAQCQAPDH